MDRDAVSRSSAKSLRTMLDIHDETLEKETIFCTSDNLANALLTLSEELESFGLLASTLNFNDSLSMKSVKYTLIKLINATWGLAHKHRVLIKVNDQASDVQHRTANDNSSLINHVKRLKDELEKKQHQLDESQEKERRLKVKFEVLSRELKREKDEVAKLRKQLQSKDIQHTHEVKRLQQNSHKLRDQLQKSVGTYVPRDKAFQNIQIEHERQLSMYKQTIHRLEENNRKLLLDNNDLRDELSLHSNAIDLQAEASGIWNDAGI
ncbi:afadin- and alpha-actinin-binding protein-like [Athalia rosae]|uniref:afadin- and alpha-actinin-binding protein-like n=1 Tax=Athalia rosae TaxID=37344 RepID=UPI002033D7E1|nr:afadin- and alpha-actinin-binding protein-like [Athalia rosae]XP_012265655.2 afadin- and alpha-actinin-binding protein-like [Athalia rosae]XP_048507967.1 afadin- and alpha-actinin-binding protein-like [Athalia rosae]XP_048507971.1 afadin- and alpha-actinin-binding protein-like [Athalia rosae]XP_048507977.1 afadin- and alpha-actinin-binding protein-like [Athalia rosae]XP_048507982.1 afadin- and alpha-actinin-binding protein-like [Athalia rosae]